MILIGISDIHGTSRIPRGRIGDPLEDFANKLEFLFKISKNNNNAPIISSGDLFDTPRDIAALSTFLYVRRKYPDTFFFTVYGQHDLYFRNKEVATSTSILEQAGSISVLNNKPFKLNENIHLYGCSWGEKLPKKILNKSASNILSIHAPIYTDPLFPGHSFIKVKEWKKKAKAFQFVICGDIHRNFISKSNGQIICNTGPMMRLKVDEFSIHHMPMAYLYDTEKHSIEKVSIKCKKPKEVLRKLEDEIFQDESDIGESFILPKSESTTIANIINDLIDSHPEKKKVRSNFRRLAGRNFVSYVNARNTSRRESDLSLTYLNSNPLERMKGKRK